MQLGLDGVTVTVAMAPAQERALRRRLAPFVAAARQLRPDPSPDLSSVMRAARLRSLLRLPATVKTEAGFSEELTRLLNTAAEVYARSLEDSTASTYRRRWDQFSRWCVEHDQQALPATPESVMAYLADLIGAAPPPALSTLRGRVAAINKIHVEHDLPVPGDDPALVMMMRGLSRALGPAPTTRQMSALRIGDLRDVLNQLSHPDPLLTRDRALLHLHAAGIGVGHLTRLTWSDVSFHGQGARLELRSAYQRAPDITFTLLRQPDRRDCPVEALAAWREMAGTVPEQVFGAVDHGGRRYPWPMTSSHLKRVITTRVTSLTADAADPARAAAVAARLLDQTPSDVLRDRAMLLLGFAGAFRRGEVTRLVWGDVRVVDDGLLIWLRQSKTDTYHRGVQVGIPLGRSLTTCPVRAVLAWKQRMQDQLGADFDDRTTTCWPAVGRAGRIDPQHPLSPEGLTQAVKRRTAAAGLAGPYGGRSLRAGFISTAADLDLPLELVAAQSRHTTLDNLAKYIRTDDPFRRNAASRIGL